MLDSRLCRNLSNILLTTMLILSALNQPFFANANQVSDLAKETVKKNNTIEKNKKDLPAIKYIKLAKDKGCVVYVNNKQAVWFVSASGEYTAEKRAKLLVNILKNIVQNNINPRDIKPYRSGKHTIVRAGDKFLFTADNENARKFGVSTHELAFKWANDIRAALGATRLVRDYSLVASRGGHSVDFERTYLGKTYKGKASWYGGMFHGRTSSDGSRFNMNEFTAAHKTWPFGTLVKVTNKKNNKTCVVKVTDRGPYIDGRIIDLSKGAAKQLDMISSGIATVELEIIGKY